MLITRIKFTRRKRYWSSPGMGVCRKTITQLFRIPRTSRAVWLSLFSTPGDTRYREPLEVVDCAGSFPELTSSEIHDNTYQHRLLNKALRPCIGKTVYLECWYE